MRVAGYYAACFVLGAVAGLAVGSPMAYWYCPLIAVVARGVFDV